MPDPQFIHEGDPFSAKQQNDVIEEVRWLSRIRGAGDIVVTRTPSGLVIGSRRPFRTSVVVRIFDVCSGGGKYKALILASDSVATESGNLAAGDFGTENGSIGAYDALVLNALEIGKSTHDIDPSGDQVFFAGTVVGFNADGKYVVAINMFQTEDCS